MKKVRRVVARNARVLAKLRARGTRRRNGDRISERPEQQNHRVVAKTGLRHQTWRGSLTLRALASPPF